MPVLWQSHPIPGGDHSNDEASSPAATYPLASAGEQSTVSMEVLTEGPVPAHAQEKVAGFEDGPQADPPCSTAPFACRPGWAIEEP